MLPPESTLDLMRTNFWYHPKVGHAGIGDPKKFNSSQWTQLWEKGARVFGDIWNPKANKPVAPPGSSMSKKAKSAVERFVDNAIPQSWKDLLEDDTWSNTPNEAEKRLRQTPRQEYEIEGQLLINIKFRSAYNIALNRRQGKVDFLERTEGPVQAYRRMFGVETVSPPQLWMARNKFGHPRIGDLLWRLLHDKVATGTDLEWIPTNQQLCPIHNVGYTKQHIWLECSVAADVWEEFQEVYGRLTDEEARIPKTMSELKVLMAVGPPLRDVLDEEVLNQLSETEKEEEKRRVELYKRRWHILFPMTVWAIWKAYLTHSHDDPTPLWGMETARNSLRQMIGKHIGTDRILCLYEKYRNKRYNPEVFRDLWGEPARTFKVRKGPQCLRDVTEPSSRRNPRSHNKRWYRPRRPRIRVLKLRRGNRKAILQIRRSEQQESIRTSEIFERFAEIDQEPAVQLIPQSQWEDVND